MLNSKTITLHIDCETALAYLALPKLRPPHAMHLQLKCHCATHSVSANRILEPYFACNFFIANWNGFNLCPSSLVEWYDTSVFVSEIKPARVAPVSADQDWKDRHHPTTCACYTSQAALNKYAMLQWCSTKRVHQLNNWLVVWTSPYM